MLVLVVALRSAAGAIGIRARAASAAGSPLPFTGSYAGAAAFADPTTVTFRGTGIATHLGASTTQGHAVMTGPDSRCPGGVANVNSQTLTAANGDSLTITSHDVACPISSNVLRGTGKWVVTGGTGRFSGASGQGTLEGYSDFYQGVFRFQLTGTISAPSQN